MHTPNKTRQHKTVTHAEQEVFFPTAKTAQQTHKTVTHAEQRPTKHTTHHPTNTHARMHTRARARTHTHTHTHRTDTYFLRSLHSTTLPKVPSPRVPTTSSAKQSHSHSPLSFASSAYPAWNLYSVTAILCSLPSTATQGQPKTAHCIS